MRELRQAAAGRSHVDKPVRRDNSRISALVKPASTSGAFAWCMFGGVLAGPVIAQVVHIHAVGDMLDAALARHDFQAREEFVLAMETAVRIVLYVVRIIELARLDVFVAETAFARESLGVALVRFGDGSGIRGNGQRILAQHAMRGPCQIRRIGAAGVRDDDAPHRLQNREQSVLLRLQDSQVELWRGCQFDQTRHNSSITASSKKLRF